MRTARSNPGGFLLPHFWAMVRCAQSICTATNCTLWTFMNFSLARAGMAFAARCQEGPFCADYKDSVANRSGNRHPRVPRCQRAWPPKPWRSGLRKTSLRCTASRRMSPIRSAVARIWQKTWVRPRAICRLARSSASPKLSGADAIHPGYGLLSESPEFADACAENGIIFIGPSPDTRRLGNKVAARNLAIEVGVPVIPATDPAGRHG